MAHDLTAERYGTILASFSAFYAWLEPVLDAEVSPGLSARLDWPARHKLQHLRNDVDGLRGSGVVVPEVDAASIELPTIDSEAAAVGALYVVEGATLGGQYIGPHIQALDFGPSNTSFFTAYGDRTGSQWKTFRVVANETLTTPEALDAAIVAARATFDSLHRLCSTQIYT